MLAIKPLTGKLRASDAYFEGTFNYYLWVVPETIRDLFGAGRPMPEENARSAKAKFILFSGRLMTVISDLATLILLFVVITEMTGRYVGALFAAFLYGIVPMQVIYSHFIRNHVLCNLLLVAVIWLSFKVLRHCPRWFFEASYYYNRDYCLR